MTERERIEKLLTAYGIKQGSKNHADLRKASTVITTYMMISPYAAPSNYEKYLKIANEFLGL